MELRAAVITLTAVLYLASFASTCTLISYTSDACRSANYIRLVLPGGVKISKGTQGRTINLPMDMREIYWYCGSSRERTAWGGMANQLKITYQRDGSIQWSVYKCSCQIKDTTYDWCRSGHFIRVEGQVIFRYSYDKVIKLPGLQSQVQWYCGNSRERAAWHNKANQLSITYSYNGRIKWVIKRCY